MRARAVALGAALGWLAVSACGGRDAKEAGSTAADSMAAAAQAIGSIASMEPLALAESDVEHFVAALEELHHAGLERESRLGTAPSEANQMFEGLSASAEAMGILRKHGFDLSRFQYVGYTVALALAADDAASSAPQVDEAIAQVEKMKGQIPKEQYDAMLAAAKGASGIVQDLRAQPQGNVDLVRRFRERLEKIGK